ncbi:MULTISPECIES: hypothetical protein, partial [unclassified Delftia]|uniref:hypothetical protein n=3 Tax=Delftia TaxID=80865 RepID=UPI001F2BFD1A
DGVGGFWDGVIGGWFGQERLVATPAWVGCFRLNCDIHGAVREWLQRSRPVTRWLFCKALPAPKFRDFELAVMAPSVRGISSFF